MHERRRGRRVSASDSRRLRHEETARSVHTKERHTHTLPSVAVTMIDRPSMARRNTHGRMRTAGESQRERAFRENDRVPLFPRGSRMPSFGKIVRHARLYVCVRMCVRVYVWRKCCLAIDGHERGYLFANARS